MGTSTASGSSTSPRPRTPWTSAASTTTATAARATWWSIYNSPSGGGCPGIDIVEVPLDAPEDASYLRFVPAGRNCHDTGVILGDAMLAACAGGNGIHILRAGTGEKIGEFVMPRKQANNENCTIHNYNVVPTDKAYIVVSGNDQSGISVADFTDPANAHEIAYADPAPLEHPTNPGATFTGGSWSASSAKTRGAAARRPPPFPLPHHEPIAY